MSQMYFILTVVGWVWMILFLVIVPVRLMWLKKRRPPRGFEVTPRSADLPASTEADGR